MKRSVMVATTQTSISLPQRLFDQAETLALQLNISQDDVFALALEQFIRSQQTTPNPIENRGINQGDIFWLKVEDAGELEADIPHPHVVIQDNVLNHSRIHTVVMCTLTSNIKKASLPGNVLLEAGEANLPRQSIVETAKVSTIGKAQLGEYIGTLSEARIHQILAGMRFLQLSFFNR